MNDDSAQGNVVEEEAGNTDHSVLLQKNAWQNITNIKNDAAAACKAAHGHGLDILNKPECSKCDPVRNPEGLSVRA